MQDRNRHTDIDRSVDTVGEGEGGRNWKNRVDMLGLNAFTATAWVQPLVEELRFRKPCAGSKQTERENLRELLVVKMKSS